jgi:hypothetical protein
VEAIRYEKDPLRQFQINQMVYRSSHPENLNFVLNVEKSHAITQEWYNRLSLGRRKKIFEQLRDHLQSASELEIYHSHIFKYAKLDKEIIPFLLYRILELGSSLLFGKFDFESNITETKIPNGKVNPLTSLLQSVHMKTHIEREQIQNFLKNIATFSIMKSRNTNLIFGSIWDFQVPEKQSNDKQLWWTAKQLESQMRLLRKPVRFRGFLENIEEALEKNLSLIGMIRVEPKGYCMIKDMCHNSHATGLNPKIIFTCMSKLILEITECMNEIDVEHFDNQIPKVSDIEGLFLDLFQSESNFEWAFPLPEFKEKVLKFREEIACGIYMQLLKKENALFQELVKTKSLSVLVWDDLITTKSLYEIIINDNPAFTMKTIMRNLSTLSTLMKERQHLPSALKINKQDMFALEKSLQGHVLENEFATIFQTLYVSANAAKFWETATALDAMKLKELCEPSTLRCLWLFLSTEFVQNQLKPYHGCFIKMFISKWYLIFLITYDMSPEK